MFSRQSGYGIDACSGSTDPARDDMLPPTDPAIDDMFDSSRPRDRRHVLPADPATATCSTPTDPGRDDMFSGQPTPLIDACSTPADPARATCSGRPIPLLTTWLSQPTPLVRHVPPGQARTLQRVESGERIQRGANKCPSSKSDSSTPRVQSVPSFPVRRRPRRTNSRVPSPSGTRGRHLPRLQRLRPAGPPRRRNHGARPDRGTRERLLRPPLRAPTSGGGRRGPRPYCLHGRRPPIGCRFHLRRHRSEQPGAPGGSRSATARPASNPDLGGGTRLRLPDRCLAPGFGAGRGGHHPGDAGRTRRSRPAPKDDRF